MRAVCPGSFDPVTHGHLDVIRRAAALFDDVIVAIGQNSAKNSLFSPDERLAMATEAVSDIPHVRAALLDGLLVDFCAERGITVIVKGLRSAVDFEFEVQMAQMNGALAGIETVFLPTSAQWSYVSSTLVRDVARMGGAVDQFVPPSVARRIQAELSNRWKESRP